MQFHQGKSYRTFCPLGPVLCLLDKTEMHYLEKLQLSLSVNSQIRQQDTTANLFFKPALQMHEIEGVVRLESGKAGVQLSHLEIVQDSKRGLVARIAAQGKAGALREKLGQYTFAVDWL